MEDAMGGCTRCVFETLIGGRWASVNSSLVKIHSAFSVPGEG